MLDVKPVAKPADKKTKSEVRKNEKAVAPIGAKLPPAVELETVETKRMSLTLWMPDDPNKKPTITHASVIKNVNTQEKTTKNLRTSRSFLHFMDEKMQRKIARRMGVNSLPTGYQLTVQYSTDHRVMNVHRGGVYNEYKSMTPEEGLKKYPMLGLVTKMKPKLRIKKREKSNDRT